MKTLLATTAIFVAISTSAFAGPKAANLVAPVNTTIETLEGQVETLAHAATSLAVQLRDALDANPDAADQDYISDLEEEVEDLEILLDTADEDYADLEDELNTVKNNWWHTKQNVIRLSSELSSAQDLASDLNEELDDVYSDLETAYDDMDDLDETISNFEITKTAYVNKIHALDAELSAANDEILGLEADVEEAEANEEYYRDLKRDVQAELDEVEAELEIAETHIANFEEQALAFLSNAEEELSTVQGELEESIALNNDLIEALEGIAEVANENAATQVLSFIASLDLDV